MILETANKIDKIVYCVICSCVAFIIGYVARVKTAPVAPQLPAVEQNQGQTVDCTFEREIKPDGTIKEKVNFKASQDQNEKIEIVPVPEHTPPKPEHSLIIIAQVDSNDLKPFVNAIYGQKLQFLDIDGLKWQAGAGFQPETVNFRGSAGLSYEW